MPSVRTATAIFVLRTWIASSRMGTRSGRAYNMGAHHGAVCAPSRAMLMSGRSLFRVYDNLDSVRTFPEILREADYRTFGTGKWHQSRSSFARSFGEGNAVFFGGMADHFNVPLEASAGGRELHGTRHAELFHDAVRRCGRGFSEGLRRIGSGYPLSGLCILHRTPRSPDAACQPCGGLCGNGPCRCLPIICRPIRSITEE